MIMNKNGMVNVIFQTLTYTIDFFIGICPKLPYIFTLR